MRGDVVVQQISHADTIQYSVDREINVIHDERTLDSGVYGPAFLIEVPSEDRAIGKAIANAVVTLQILRGPRSGMPRQICGRGNDHKARLAHDAHRNHIALNLLAKADTGVETFTNDVGRHLDHGNVQSLSLIHISEPTRRTPIS